MAVVDNTTLGVVNLTVVDMTIRREAAAAVAAGKPILDEIPTRPHSCAQISTTRRTDRPF